MTAPGVLVIGMHRSGTSAVTRAVALLGARTCRDEDMIRARNGNARGYWESASLVRFNDDLLARSGGAWWCPPSPEALSAGLLDSRLKAARGVFARSHPLDGGWVWKDPRNCLLLPFWTRALEGPLLSLLVLRNPLEIAGSLRKRDRIGKSWALGLWERYLRTALSDLAGTPVLVTDYAELLADPGGWSRTLQGFLTRHGIQLESSNGQAAASIDPSLRHNQAGAPESDARASEEQRQLWRVASGLRGAHDALPAIALPEETRSTPEVFAELRARRLRQSRHRAMEDEMTELLIDSPAELTPDWCRWLAKNRMLGMDDAQLLQVMAANGVSEGLARAEIARLASDTAYLAGQWIGQRLRKLESMLDVQETLRGLAPSSRKVERRRGVTTAEFLGTYYSQNRPLVLLDFADAWRARDWTPESIEAVLGDEPVEVMSGRESDDRYELNAELHRSTVPFRDYTERVVAGGPSNDAYLVANNHLLDRPAAEALWEDFDAGQPPLDAAKATGNAFLWFGPGGTVTPLHHDVMNVLFVQLYGRKRFTLIAPSFTGRVYNEIGVYSEVDPEDPDYASHPAFRGVPTTALILEPGDTLFLPVGWWHRVEALDVSISLSFTNFAWANEFRWQHPGG